MEAAVKAVEALDHCVEEVAKAVESVGGQLLITADTVTLSRCAIRQRVRHTRHTPTCQFR